MTRSSARFVVALFALSGVALLALPACEKKKPPPPLEAPPPPPPDAGVVQLVPLDDAGDAAPEAAPSGPARHGGGGHAPLSANSARIKACCNAIRHEATKLGAAPEAMVMMSAAVQCDMVAIQASSGTAPEFGQVRTLLKGHTLPNACDGM